MKKLICIAILSLTISACTWLKPGQSVTVTDTETGNSVTVSEEGVELDINTLEHDGYQVEVE